MCLITSMQENLKRWVRDLLVRRRMVAFLLMDSPKESIIDLQVLSNIILYLVREGLLMPLNT